MNANVLLANMAASIDEPVHFGFVIHVEIFRSSETVFDVNLVITF